MRLAKEGCSFKNGPKRLALFVGRDERGDHACESILMS